MISFIVIIIFFSSYGWSQFFCVCYFFFIVVFVAVVSTFFDVSSFVLAHQLMRDKPDDVFWYSLPLLLFSIPSWFSISIHLSSYNWWNGKSLDEGERWWSHHRLLPFYSSVFFFILTELKVRGDQLKSEKRKTI